MNILAFDTVSNNVSIALAHKEKILSQKLTNSKSNQSEILLDEIAEILNKNNLCYQNLNLIATTNGPGSFTGSRIGLVVAKTIKLATNLPLILLNCLEVIAYQNQQETTNKAQKILVVIDAKANEFFYCPFDFDEKISLNLLQPKIVNIDNILTIIPQESFLLCGSGAEIIDNILQKNHINNYQISDKNQEIKPKYIANLAYQKFINGFESKNLDPIYLRKPNITKRKSPNKST